MSEEYKSACKALQLKDLMLAFLPDIMNIEIVLCAFTGIVAFCADKATTIVFAVATAVAGIAYLAMHRIAVQCDRKMERLGYSEVELEADAISAEQ